MGKGIARRGAMRFKQRDTGRLDDIPDPSQRSHVEGEETMKTSDAWAVIQGDEQCRDGHYRTKLDLRSETAIGIGAVPAVALDPNDSASLQAQNPSDFGKLRVGRSRQRRSIERTVLAANPNRSATCRAAALSHACPTASSNRLLKGALLGNCGTFSTLRPQSGQHTRYTSTKTVVPNSMQGRSRTARALVSCAISNSRPHPEHTSF